jgi:hypothetical protein
LAWSIAFCAKATGADNISPKPNSVSVRFILFVPLHKGKINLTDFRDEATLLGETRTRRQRHECARFSDLLSSKDVNKWRVAPAELDKQRRSGFGSWLLA